MESTVGVFFFLMYVFVWKGYEMQIEESIYKTKIDTSEEGNKQKTSLYWN